MRFAYYAKLSAADQRIYRRSDAIVTLPLPAGVVAGEFIERIRDGLLGDDVKTVQRACQALVDALVAGYGVPPIRIRVLARRPSDDYGELHGLYEPEEDRKPARITVWMRTAAKAQVVAFKTFLRTIVHEVGHHLDYEHFKLEETFHTEGFYKRESSLANALLAQLPDAASPRPPDTGITAAPASPGPNRRRGT